MSQPEPETIPARLRADDPRLIYCSVTGFGQTGPYAERAGYDLMVQAMCGLMSITGEKGRGPMRVGIPINDLTAGNLLALGIMMKLYDRERTGQGGLVHASLLETGLWSNGFMVQAALCGATFYPRPPRESLPNALTGYYRCRDDRWLILTILNEERQWPVFATSLGLERLIADPRFAAQKERFANSPALIAELDAAFATRDRDDWRKVLTAAGIVFEIVASAEDVPNDQQAIDNGILVPIAGQDTLTVSSPFYVAGQEKVAPRRAPDIGQDSDAILSEAGFDAQAIAGLRAGKVIG